MSRLLALIAVLHAGIAGAQALPDPDTEVAQRHYASAVAAYDAQRYADALREFRLSRRTHAAPELDYNIGRCLDRLEQWDAAADAYARYAEQRPNGASVAELRERIVVLRKRGAEERETGARRYRLAGGLVLGAALALGVAGAGVYGEMYATYAHQRDVCMMRCAPDAGLADHVRASQIASGVLWGVAGAALVVDLALWGVYAKRHGRERAPALAWSPAGVTF